MVPWEPWSAAAFARASREAKPVLLSITAAWCGACHEMDRTTYADPGVAALVAERFVPVRVDADHRPDINERYNLGGWPTTAFLTADGQLITGGTFIAVDRMPGVLTRVAEAFAARVVEYAANHEAAEAAASPAYEDTGAAESGDATGGAQGMPALVDAIFATFDEQHAGFGVEPKFPHAAPLHLALALWRDTREPRWRTIAERTLDAMWNGGLWDTAGGGFFRYAATRDWRLPHVEKLLETNATLLAVYAEAAVVLSRSVDRDRTAAVARFITTSLRDERGGYFGSDAERVLYADGNALAASSLIKAGAVLSDSTLVKEALASFERVLLACYKPGAGLAHDVDRGVRGLLGDQIAAIAALLDAHDLTDGEPYQMMAEELGHFTVRALEDSPAGGLFDRAPREDDVGLLRMRRKPFVANAEAAVALSRLQRVSRDYDFATAAAGALLAAARQAAHHGPLAAHYVLAARELR
jgi:uncharacterized protein YyaL (SSP411 family)